MTRFAAGVLTVFGLVCFGAAGAEASVITVTLGNAASGFANGSIQTSASVLAAQSGQPAPFNGPCGADPSSNCNQSWTLNYGAAIPAGETIVAAELTLGIFDIDSKATGTQVGNYAIGSENLTVGLNALAEAVNGGAGSNQSQYDVFTIALANIVALNASSSASVALRLQGPGQGALGATTFNGASLIYSSLRLTTEASGNPNPTPVPEPGSMMLLATGIGILARARARKSI